MNAKRKDMTSSKTSQKIFLLITFIWSFTFWGLSIYLSIKNELKLLESLELLSIIMSSKLSGTLLIITLLGMLAGYGPLLGAIIILIINPSMRRYFKNNFKLNTPFKYYLQIISLFFIITVVPAIPLMFLNGITVTPIQSIILLLTLFFIYQFITSGTEEIGWRGYLLPSMLQTKTPWQASISIGIIWALWHTPIILYVFYGQGLTIPQIIISFIGFIAGTIAMATIHTYYYLKTKNILFNMFIHAISNTLPMFIGSLLILSYEISVMVQVLLWVFVIYLTKKNKTLFDTVQKNY